MSTFAVPPDPFEEILNQNQEEENDKKKSRLVF